MATRPPQLIYSVNETPPRPIVWILALQHVAVLSVGWVFVVLIGRELGSSPEEAQSVIRMTMIASGIGVIVQALRVGSLGSGYLCPFSCGPAFVSASLLAGKAGGWALIFYMIALVGLLEGLLSRLIFRLRVLFPPEVTGLVVTMVGLELVGLGCSRFIDVNSNTPGGNYPVFWVAFMTLVSMVAPTVWAKGKFRLYPVLFGLPVGYLFAMFTGVLQPADFQHVLAAPWFEAPSRLVMDFSFDPILVATLIPAFFIATMSSMIKTVGDISLCQKINDHDWKRADMNSVAGGILSAGITNLASGLLGGIGQSTFSSNVGLSQATGATSRAIAVPCGIFLIGLAFFPRLGFGFSIMPEPVMGAVLVYVASFMIVGGLQIITTRMLDARKTFVVGIPLIFALSVKIVPGLYAGVPAGLQPLFSSILSLGTVLAVLLNLVFRLGIAKSVNMMLEPDVADNGKIFSFMEAQGAAWGARPEVIQRATVALTELHEGVVVQGLSTQPLQVEARFDEFNLDLYVRYQGHLMEFPSGRPTPSANLIEGDGMEHLSGYLVRQYSDTVEGRETEGECRIQLHFDH